MQEINGKWYVTVDEIISKSRNATYNAIYNCIQNQYFRGIRKSPDGQHYWLIPLDIANDYIYIVDHQQEMIRALLLRIDAVKNKYGVTTKYIFGSAELDSSVVSKYKSGRNKTLTYRTIYKLCQGPVGLRCRISTLVKIAQTNADTTYTDTFKVKDYSITKDPSTVELERIIKIMEDKIHYLQQEVDRLKYISKVDRRKLKKFNKLMNEPIKESEDV